MNTTPKVAYLLTSLAAGGSERNVLNLCLHARKKIVQSEIISVTKAYDYTEEYKSNEFIIHSLLQITTKIPKYSLVTLWTILYKIFFLIKKENYKVLIGAVEIYPYYLTICFASILRIKSILIVGNNLSEELKQTYTVTQFIHKILLIISFKKADRIICVSYGVQEDLIKNFLVSKEKIVVIYNGVDVKKITSVSKQKGARLLDKKEYIVTFGRLFPKKGYFGLVKAFSLVLRSYPNLFLVIIGKGPLEKPLKAFAKTVGVEKRILFLGFVKQNPYSILSRAKLFVFSSLYEGFGNVLVEAMACGIPVVSTNCLYGPLEICDKKKNYGHKTPHFFLGKYGVITPVFPKEKKGQELECEEKEMAKAIDTVLQNRELQKRYSVLSKKRAQAFTIQRMIEQYHRVIENLVR